MTKEYSAKDITVLEGLEGIRQRPTMYIGTIDKNGFHHLLWEILDNAIDEIVNGHGNEINVSISADRKTACIEDNGRGIPVDIIPKFNKSALEVILTNPHSGGKFNKENYEYSGGLNGVGTTVVNALSSDLQAIIYRDGNEYTQTYAKGSPTSKLTSKKSQFKNKTGTLIRFTPDSSIFNNASFDIEEIANLIEVKSYLHQGIKFSLSDQGFRKTTLYHSNAGLNAYIEKIIEKNKYNSVGPSIYLNKTDPKLEIAFKWTENTNETFKSFVNSIPTKDGGTHESGLKSAINKSIKAFGDEHNLFPKNLTITADDVREGLVAIISIYVKNPQFQGQTKDRLNNPEIVSVVETHTKQYLDKWLIENKKTAEEIIMRIIMSARAREAARSATQNTKKQSVTSGRTLPGKLADCASTDIEENELFIVEGDSAGGSAKQARNRITQAILPLRGKVLNVESVSTDKVVKNTEINSIIQSLGCGIGKNYDDSKLRYGKIIILTDADSDGNHIATLLLTFFYRHMKKLISNGHLYIATPPLYKIEINKQAFWALDDAEKDKIIKNKTNYSISRFKGLGEMPAEDLKKTTLDPKNRKLLKISINDILQTDKIINDLMGKDAAPRYEFVMKNANKADVDL